MGIQETKPIYLQLADKLMNMIAEGRIAADERVPSVREFAADNQVNVNTAMRSFDYLTSKRIIYNRRGMGYYADPRGAELVAELRREEFMHHDMEYFFSRVRSFGMDVQSLAELYREYLDKHK